MNQQPIFYGQLVIGPAGSGKVCVFRKEIMKNYCFSSRLIVKSYKKWGNY